jgi:large subunit ribosomal protein L18
MAAIETSFERRKRRIAHNVRAKSNGRPRLSVFKSNKNIHVQLIDDANGVTIAAASTVDKELKGKIKSTSSIAAAAEVGALVAKRAKEQKITEIVFDRGGYRFHGRVKALADAAREAGLKF